MAILSALELTSGIYSLFVGSAIVGLWVMLIIKKAIPELQSEPVTIYFHITAEMMMGLFSIVSGILILTDFIWGIYLFLVSSGFCLYAVVNSAGYYAQRKTWIFVILFALIFIISFTLSIMNIILLIS